MVGIVFDFKIKLGSNISELIGTKKFFYTIIILLLSQYESFAECYLDYVCIKLQYKLLGKMSPNCTIEQVKTNYEIKITHYFLIDLNKNMRIFVIINIQM